MLWRVAGPSMTKIRYPGFGARRYEDRFEAIPADSISFSTMSPLMKIMQPN